MTSSKNSICLSDGRPWVPVELSAGSHAIRLSVTPFNVRKKRHGCFEIYARETDTLHYGQDLLQSAPWYQRIPLSRLQKASRIRDEARGPLSLSRAQADLCEMQDTLLRGDSEREDEDNHAFLWSSHDVPASGPGYPSLRRRTKAASGHSEETSQGTFLMQVHNLQEGDALGV
jgi:hypothetical protein